jgi:hypothetical protein
MKHWPVELIIERYNPRCGMWEPTESVAIRGYELPRTQDEYKAARVTAYDWIEQADGGTYRIIEVFDNGRKWQVWADGQWIRATMESLYEETTW